MNKSVPPDQEDLAFFREAMKDVKPTKSHAKTKLKKKIYLSDKKK